MRNAEIEAQISQFVAAATTGDHVAAAKMLAPLQVVVDEAAPYLWQGAHAYADWARDLAISDKAAGITDHAMVQGAFMREEVSAQVAYVVLGLTYSFTQKGVAMREPVQMTFVLNKTTAGWKIASLSFAVPEATPAK